MSADTITRKSQTGEPTTNGGHFGSVSHDEADIALDAITPAHEQPVVVSFTLTRFANDYDDDGQETERLELDVRAILDTEATEFLPTEDDFRWDPSRLEEAAIEGGYIDPDGCSVTADVGFIDEDNPVLVYAQSRRAAGLNAPLGTVLPLAPEKQYEEVGTMFRQAYQEIGATTVLRRLDAGDEQGLREDFQRLGDVMEARMSSPAFPDEQQPEDTAVINGIRAIATTPHAQFREKAIYVASLLTDRIVNRPATLNN